MPPSKSASTVVGIAVWTRGLARQRYWERLKAGIEYREAVAAQRAVEHQTAGRAIVE